MGLLDRFKSKKDSFGKNKKPKHVVAPKSKGDQREQQRRQFAAVPAAGAVDRPAVTKDDRPSDRRSKRSTDTGPAYRILLRTVVTEKATRLQTGGQYVFAVAPSANKLEVSRAIHHLYGVRPTRVNIINVGGKFTRYGRTSGRTKAWKKAVVTVPTGQKLDISGA
ncbi:MAG: 50S ribosomal protein L23 [Candidatus Kerfeldbacteria bacterium]|nr:50S ribosomal protein L23 [Candidatus Kerfeldbacteria bacterium]